MITKLPSRFVDIMPVHNHDDGTEELVRSMQIAYNHLSKLIDSLKSDTNPDIQSILSEHNDTRQHLANSIELFYNGICVKEVEKEIIAVENELKRVESKVEKLKCRLADLNS